MRRVRRRAALPGWTIRLPGLSIASQSHAQVRRIRAALKPIASLLERDGQEVLECGSRVVGLHGVQPRQTLDLKSALNIGVMTEVEGTFCIGDAQRRELRDLRGDFVRTCRRVGYHFVHNAQ